MMKIGSVSLVAVALILLASGCASSYAWRTEVPRGMRTVSVPTFRNESSLQEMGAIASRQVLRELQRVGAFTIRPTGQAALEVQGTISSVSAGGVAYSRRSGLRLNAFELNATAVVSVVDKRNGRVLVNNRTYVARTTMTAGADLTTAERDASGRLADDLSRQVVDDLLTLKWE